MNILQEAILSEITLPDLDELVNLHNIYLDYGPSVEHHFRKVLTDPQNIALKYSLDNRIIGVLIYTAGISFSTSYGNLAEKVHKITGDKIVYTGDAVLVVKEYRHTHISGLMYQEAVKRMKAIGVQYVIHELWVHPDGSIPAKSVLGYYGNTLDFGFQKGFYQEFYQHGRTCPICGRDCKCSAEIYMSELH